MSVNRKATNLESDSFETERSAKSSFTESQKEIIFSKAEKLTGTCQRGRYRKDILLNNIEKRMHATEIMEISAYLNFAETNAEERQYLLSALTIHTTNWFREPSHYSFIEKLVSENVIEFLDRPLTIYCAASSTGEEAYSFALVLESIRQKNPKFDYKITGCDIDPISIEKAKRGIYETEGGSHNNIPPKYRNFMLMGSGKTSGFFTLDKEIRRRCEFGVANMTEKIIGVTSYDIVVCRNALIYFEPNVMKEIVSNLTKIMKPNGLFIVGTSDFIEPASHGLRDLGKSIYCFEKESPLSGKASAPKILIVDDSATIRNSLSKLLIKSGYRADSVASAQEASEYLKREKVSLITLDLHMPGTDGQTWLTQQRAKGLQTPVVIISGASPSEAKSVLNALGSGAQDYFEKESLMSSPERVVEGLAAIMETDQKRKTKTTKNISKEAVGGAPKLKIKPKRPEMLLFGSSTGGTEALVRVLEKMPTTCPPIVIVQHINLNYAKAFHERLARASGLQMEEAQNGVVLKRGHIYMAHTDQHIEVVEKNGEYKIKTTSMAAINGVRPAVDCLFRSATLFASKVCAVLLTGMGKDGAQGMAELRKKGATTFAQDEDSCVVFGMPKAAIALGAAMMVGNLGEIRVEVKSIIETR